MTEPNNNENIDFTVDQASLYREESITDLKVASIRRLVPVKPDGSDDPSRTPIFYGSTQLMTPEGPLPLQAQLMANNLKEAYEVFPDTMKAALSDMIEKIQQLHEEKKKENDSRIIVPGR